MKRDNIKIKEDGGRKGEYKRWVAQIIRRHGKRLIAEALNA
jgi:hypothetical protein